MMRNFVANLSKRCFASTSTAKDYTGKVKTAILFTHHGRPTTANEAKTLITDTVAQRYRLIPELFSKAIVSAWLKGGGGKRIDRAFSADTHIKSSRNDDADMCWRLQSSLDTLLPEHGPFVTDVAYTHAGPTVEQGLRAIHKRSPSRVLIIPLHPHYYCFTHQSGIGSVVEELQKTTMSVDSHPQNRRIIRADDDYDSNAESCKYELIDRLNTHPVLADVWSNQLKDTVQEYMPSDTSKKVGVVFVAARHKNFNSAQYRADVTTTCARTIEQLDNSLPYQVAFTRWPYQPSLFAHDYGRQNILTSIRRLTRNNIRNIVIFPIDELGGAGEWSVQPIKELLTRNVLRILRCEQVHIAAPGRMTNKHVVTGLAELVRNHLLHPDERRPNAMWQLQCRHCYRWSCKHARHMFRPT